MSAFVILWFSLIFCKELPNGLRYWRVGGMLILSTGRKNLTVEKCQKSRTVPTRPVHALLARFCYARLDYMF
jgi:hypothetical protein